MTHASDPGLENNKLFQGVAPEAMKELVKIPEIVTMAPEQVIFEEGETGDHLFLIVDGSVRISKRGRGDRQEVLAYLGAGDFFGDMVAYDPAPRSARATAVEETRLGSIDREGLEELFRLAPIEIHRNLARGLILRLRQLDDQLIRELLRAERLSAIGSMAATIIHDFRNPMSTLSMTAGLLEEQADNPLMAQLSGLIKRSVHRMTGMAEELLDFSRGRVNLQLGPVAVGDLLQDLDEQILTRLPPSITVERRIGFDGELVVDRGRFGRVLLNLIKNAAEAMPGGGTLGLTVQEAADRVLFTVSDTGHGIPAEFLPRLFEPFESHGKEGGTGLGMAIVKSVVEAHDGAISVASAEGEGTTFQVAVPRVPHVHAA